MCLSWMELSLPYLLVDLSLPSSLVDLNLCCEGGEGLSVMMCHTLLSVQGSVYVCGYNVEGQVQASEHCPSPASMHQMRQLHDGQAKGMVSSVSAGLNYLLALGINSGKTGLVWGKLELPHLSRHWHYCSKASAIL